MVCDALFLPLLFDSFCFSFVDWESKWFFCVHRIKCISFVLFFLCITMISALKTEKNVYLDTSHLISTQKHHQSRISISLSFFRHFPLNSPREKKMSENHIIQNDRFTYICQTVRQQVLNILEMWSLFNPFSGRNFKFSNIFAIWHLLFSLNYIIFGLFYIIFQQHSFRNVAILYSNVKKLRTKNFSKKIVKWAWFEQ